MNADKLMAVLNSNRNLSSFLRFVFSGIPKRSIFFMYSLCPTIRRIVNPSKKRTILIGTVPKWMGRKPLHKPNKATSKTILRLFLVLNNVWFMAIYIEQDGRVV